MKTFSDYLESEIKERFAIWEDGEENRDEVETYTRGDALKDILFSYDRFDANDFSKEDRLALKEIRQHFIDLGIYEEMTPEKLERRLVSSGKKYEFILNGRKWSFLSWEPLEKEYSMEPE